MGKSHGEEWILKVIKEYFGNIVVKRNYPIGNRLSIDIFLPTFGVGIEYDGVQHFKQIDYFHEDRIDFLKGQYRDRNTEDQCAEQNISLIRIKYNNEPTDRQLVTLIIEHAKNNTPRRDDFPKKKNEFKIAQKQFARKMRKENYKRLKEWKKDNKI